MPGANGGIGILSLLTFLPLLGALVLLFMPAERVKDIRIFTNNINRRFVHNLIPLKLFIW